MTREMTQLILKAGKCGDCDVCCGDPEENRTPVTRMKTWDPYR